jgi:hypothetical protein
MRFDELMDKPNKTEMELALVQCLAALLITPAYSKYSAETLFEMMKRSACQTGW